MKIFPLSIAGKIALILIAVFLGIIFSMLQNPQWWMEKLRKRLSKKEEAKKDKK